MLTESTVNQLPFLLLTDEQLQRIQDAELEAYEAMMNDETVHLTERDRQFIIAGLIGEYQYLCHDDAEIDDMTPAEMHSVLVHYTDNELIHDADLHESDNTPEEFYSIHCNYIPAEYQVN
tara:strand:+ start:118 stop:477 length:360 start_codon:yes stop_codon:yes gene_type:complete